jgi:hypothetical protein
MTDQALQVLNIKGTALFGIGYKGRGNAPEVFQNQKWTKLKLAQQALDAYLVEQAEAEQKEKEAKEQAELALLHEHKEEILDQVDLDESPDEIELEDK